MRPAVDDERDVDGKSQVRNKPLFPFRSLQATPGLISYSPTKLLRSFPPLQAKKIIELTLNWVRKIPVDVYEELVHHAE